MARGITQRKQNVSSRETDALGRVVARHVRRRRDLIAEAADNPVRSDAVAVAALTRLVALRSGKGQDRPRLRSIVVASDGAALPLLTAAISHRIEPGMSVSIVTLLPESESRREASVSSRHPDILVAAPARIIDHIRRDTIDLSELSTVVVDLSGEGSIEQFSADLHFIYAKLDKRPTTVVLAADLGREFDLLEDLMRRPTTIADTAWASSPRPSTTSHEESTMSDLPFDPDRLKDRVADIVRAIHHEEDAVELTAWRKHVRRHTTVFNRGYVLAYLLKQNMEGQGRPSRPPKKQSDSEQEKQSIFVSIGRSKRVRSRDLITFFTSADGINQEDIGQVKVLDNYSFVEVNPDKAQAAIDDLNGKEFRGRKLTVNFARRK